MAEKTVLIIDDEARMADSLRDLLIQHGYRARCAHSGREAIPLLNKEAFKVVVTDLRMQGIHGLDVIKYIHDNFPRTLIIVITGHATTDSAIEAVHYQVFDYLRKPFEFDHFRMAIEKAFHKLETEQLREDTAAMITHDIKIPLTSIIGFASMIYDQQTGQTHVRAREFAETIEANGRKILELIENYLTTSNIESGTLQLNPVCVDPKSAVHDVAENARIEAGRLGVEIIEEYGDDLPEIIHLDEMLLYRALGNLLQNAVKFNSSRDPIQLRTVILSAEESPLRIESLSIRVMNDAQDCLPGDFENVFDRYSRGKAGGVEGSGIGLYVVQAVAEAHGGVATARLTDVGQACFEVILPMNLKPKYREPETV